ncbi:unnamed protein product [Schistocephalus solidus]|uniref:SAC domain-containing protein n=1 Tax=Schistocephalus solidus TaxID=70667 RepID=A0A183SAI9_SCHSO|nr:unnamed protein product [Schistocephalus solidus]
METPTISNSLPNMSSFILADTEDYLLGGADSTKEGSFLVLSHCIECDSLVASIIMRGPYYFVIVSHEDCPIFELAQPGAPKSSDQKVRFHSPHKFQIDLNYLTQFVAHASLDMVDENMWNTPSTYLKVVDRFNDWLVSAFITPADILFLD